MSKSTINPETSEIDDAGDEFVDAQSEYIDDKSPDAQEVKAEPQKQDATDIDEDDSDQFEDALDTQNDASDVASEIQEMSTEQGDIIGRDQESIEEVFTPEEQQNVDNLKKMLLKLSSELSENKTITFGGILKFGFQHPIITFRALKSFLTSKNKDHIVQKALIDIVDSDQFWNTLSEKYNLSISFVLKKINKEFKISPEEASKLDAFINSTIKDKNNIPALKIITKNIMSFVQNEKKLSDATEVNRDNINKAMTENLTNILKGLSEIGWQEYHKQDYSNPANSMYEIVKTFLPNLHILLHNKLGISQELFQEILPHILKNGQDIKDLLDLASNPDPKMLVSTAQKILTNSPEIISLIAERYPEDLKNIITFGINKAFPLGDDGKFTGLDMTEAELKSLLSITPKLLDHNKTILECALKMIDHKDALNGNTKKLIEILDPVISEVLLKEDLPGYIQQNQEFFNRQIKNILNSPEVKKSISLMGKDIQLNPDNLTTIATEILKSPDKVIEIMRLYKEGRIYDMIPKITEISSGPLSSEALQTIIHSNLHHILGAKISSDFIKDIPKDMLLEFSKKISTTLEKYANTSTPISKIEMASILSGVINDERFSSYVAKHKDEIIDITDRIIHFVPEVQRIVGDKDLKNILHTDLSVIPTIINTATNNTQSVASSIAQIVPAATRSLLSIGVKSLDLISLARHIVSPINYDDSKKQIEAMSMLDMLALSKSTCGIDPRESEDVKHYYANVLSQERREYIDQLCKYNGLFNAIKIEGKDLSSISFNHTRFINTKISNSTFKDISNVRFDGSSIADVNFTGNLQNVHFEQATLKNISFKGATIDGATLRALKKAKSLENISFEGATITADIQDIDRAQFPGIYLAKIEDLKYNKDIGDEFLQTMKVQCSEKQQDELHQIINQDNVIGQYIRNILTHHKDSLSNITPNLESRDILERISKIFSTRDQNTIERMLIGELAHNKQSTPQTVADSIKSEVTQRHATTNTLSKLEIRTSLLAMQSQDKEFFKKMINRKDLELSAITEDLIKTVSVKSTDRSFS